MSCMPLYKPPRFDKRSSKSLILAQTWVTYKPNGQQIFLSGAGGGTMWDVSTGELMFTYPVPEGDWINISDFSPDGSLLFLSGESWDGGTPLPSHITILEAETGQKLVEFQAHDHYIQVVAVSPDGKLSSPLSVLTKRSKFGT